MTKEQEAVVLNTLEQTQLYLDALLKTKGSGMVPAGDGSGELCGSCLSFMVDKTIDAMKGDDDWDAVH